jgi:hypothetical protein
MQTRREGVRSLLATIVGYIIVALVALILLRFVVGTVFWLIRAFVVVIVLLALLAIYVRLKSPD